ncbi:MAG: outer membrane protein transport protein, partial [Verrucomicrobiales bacterium]
PYTFQSHPSLAGFKTLLDLETEGYGVNADVGIAWRPDESLTLALSYRTPTSIETHGTATGDLREQFDNLGLAAPSTFRYDAEVANEFPDILSAGLSWQATEKTRLSFQTDWIGWSDSFDSLTVRLDNGSNDSINGLLGDDGIVDTIPLDWKDRFVFRAGLDHQIASDWFLRAGYSHGRSPVPDSTLTPMTAAISEHAVAFGVGHVRGPLSVDIAYQIDLPESRTSSSTSILSGEYAGSTIDLTAHWIALTVGYEF